MVMEQYNHDTAGMIPAPDAEAKTRRVSELKIEQLEEQLAKQYHEIQKLHREVARLKNDLDSIVSTLRSRG